MEFWGMEVKSGQPLEVSLAEGKVLHLSQACLGEIKNPKASDSVCLHINIEGKKLVLGTLNSERLPQQLFDLVFDKDFQLSHNWKSGSVFFYGYKADQPTDDYSDDENVDSDEDKEALELPIPNGGKQGAKKEENPVVANKKDTKQKVKIVEPEKNDSDEDDSMSEDSDEDDEGSDSEDDSEEEEETPKKASEQQSGKKRPNESAIKTPANEKKAKMSTPPKKTDGKKGAVHVHVATPHPSKQNKTPANKPNQESPASASGGAYSCKSCNRNFKSDMALQSHNQAKHK